MHAKAPSRGCEHRIAASVHAAVVLRMGVIYREKHVARSPWPHAGRTQLRAMAQARPSALAADSNVCARVMTDATGRMESLVNCGHVYVAGRT